MSKEFIEKEWQRLHIINEDYAKSIGLVAMAHRKVDLMDIDLYEPQFFVQKVGRDYVCLPYLGCIIRIADELDITNMRVPELLFDYFLPHNEESREEWQKHKSNYHVNFKDDFIVLKAKTSDQSVYHALIAQYKKIKDVIEYCQKVINRRCTF